MFLAEFLPVEIVGNMPAGECVTVYSSLLVKQKSKPCAQRCEHDLLLVVKYEVVSYEDQMVNQLLSGLAIILALLYAMSKVIQVCP